MSGGMLAAIIGGLALLLVIGIVLAIRAGGFTKVAEWPPKPGDAAAAGEAGPPLRTASEVAPPATLRTAMAIAMRELRVLVGGGRGPVDVPWVLAIGAGGEALPGLLPPPLGDEYEVAWLDEQKVAKVGTVSFREGGIVLGFEDGLVGQPEAERRLRELLREVEVVRPTRPIDSLVVVVPWTLLAEGSEDAVAAHGRHLYELILTVQQRTGWRVPVYLLISEAERLPGFAMLARAAMARVANPVIGWPAPKALDTMFDPTWTDDAFAALRRALSIEQLHVMMALDDDTARENMLLLPDRLEQIEPAVRLLLARMLESSAYHEGFMLRGMFLTGETAEPGGAAEPVPAAMAITPPDGEAAMAVAPPHSQPLAQILFREKIFPEAHLAQPAYGERTRRHRLVRRAQYGLAASVVLAALGLAAIPYQASHRVPPVDSLLKNIMSIEQRSAGLRQGNARCVERQALGPHDPLGKAASEASRRQSVSLLERMSELDIHRIESLFAPTSLLSGTDERIESAIKKSFHDVVFVAIAESMTNPVGIEALLTRNTPENDFEGYWKATIENAAGYDRHYQMLRDMRTGTDKAARLKGFAETVQYALGEELPPGFSRNYRVYAEGIGEVHVPCLYSGVVAEAVHRVLAERYARAVQLLYLENPVSIAARAIADRFPPEAEDADHEKSLRDLADELDRIAAELTTPRKYAWIYGDRPMPRIDTLVKLHATDTLRIERLPDENRRLVGDEIDRLRAATLYEMPLLIEDRSAAAKEILAKPIPAGGMTEQLKPAAMNREAGLPQLSPGAIDTRNFLRSMFSQPFMATDGAIAKPIEGFRISWDLTKLQTAQAAAKGYLEFAAISPAAMPLELHATAMRTARIHFAHHIDHLLRGAALSNTSALPGSEAETLSFAQALPLLIGIRDGLSRAGAHAAAQAVDDRIVGQAALLLRDADRALRGIDPYAVVKDSLARWDGTESLALAAFAFNSMDDLKASMDGRQTRVSDIAQPLVPIIAYLRVSAAARGETATLVNRWQAILRTLELKKASNPNNALDRLETFMTTGLDKLSWAECARLRVSSGHGDYFAQQRALIEAQIARRCGAVAIQSIEQSYAELRKSFNDLLAGRFPFSATDTAAGADPADVQAFFLQYGDRLEPLKEAIDADPGFGPSGRSAASIMLSRLLMAREALAPMLDAGQSPLVYKVRVNFFPEEEAFALGEGQVSEFSMGTGLSAATDSGANSFVWSNGDPVVTRMRWAANAPTLPRVPGLACAPLATGNYFTAETAGDWALLRLLRERGQRPRNGAAAPAIPVMFEVPLCENRARAAGGDPVRDKARIFLRLSLARTIAAPGQPDKDKAVVVPDFPYEMPGLVRGRGR